MRVRDFLSLVLGDTSGHLAVSYPDATRLADATRDTSGWHGKSASYPWPEGLDTVLVHVREATRAHVPKDVYFCPAVRSTTRRRKGESVGAWCVWADLDGPAADEELLERLDPLIVESGSPGSAHVYLPLAAPVSAEEVMRLNYALMVRLGADNKWTDNSLLRIPETFNHKHDPPRAVFAREWHGTRWDPDTLGQLLGADAVRVDVTRSQHADLSAGMREHLIAKYSTGGEPDAVVSEVYERAVADLAGAVAAGTLARHDWARDYQLRLLRYGEQDHPGVGMLLEHLETHFTEALAGDRDGAGEFHRGLVGAVEVIAGSPSSSTSVGEDLGTGTSTSSEGAETDTHEWPEPTALKPVPLSAPMTQLPNLLIDVIRTVARHTQIAPELVLLTGLSAVSACISGGQVRVRGGHVEQLSVYTIGTEHSGGRKSSVLKIVGTDPVLAACRAVGSQPELVTLDQQVKMTRAQVERMERDAVKAHPSVNQEEVFAKHRELDALTARRPVPRFLLTDGTIESVELCMAAQGGPFALFAAEGGLVETLSGRYSDRGTQSVSALNSAYSGDLHRVSRVKGDRWVDHPSGALGMLVQPNVLASMLGNDRWRQVGLLARWWYAQPATRVGYRSVDPPELDTGVLERWRELLTSVLSRYWATPTNQVMLECTDEAVARARKYFAEVEEHLRDLADRSGAEATWLAKVYSHVPRAAALYALIEDPRAAKVTGRHVVHAITLVRWLHAEATRAFAGGVVVEAEGVDVEHAVTLLQWARRRRDRMLEREEPEPDVFTVRDVTKNGPRLFRYHSDEVEGLLESLAEANWVRRVPTPPNKPGRPSSRWQAHPRLAAALAALRRDEASPDQQVPTGSGATQNGHLHHEEESEPPSAPGGDDTGPEFAPPPAPQLSSDNEVLGAIGANFPRYTLQGSSSSSYTYSDGGNTYGDGHAPSPSPAPPHPPNLASMAPNTSANSDTPDIGDEAHELPSTCCGQPVTYRLGRWTCDVCGALHSE